MAPNKTPGNDGLPPEFYIAFYDVIGDDLMKCLNSNFDMGALTISQRRAIITLIEKSDRDVRLIKSWRPISLLNTDTKVISKILVSRIKNHLTNIIDDVQFAYVKERYIGEPVRIIADILEYTVAQKLPGVLFGADYEAAFDSTDHNFIFATLKRFGFKQDFIRWVQILHLNAESCIINNGFSSKYIRLTRGTRQGDPLASYLFILVMQIFSSIIKFDKEIKGIPIENTEIKMVLFADDSTFFLMIYFHCFFKKISTTCSI